LEQLELPVQLELLEQQVQLELPVQLELLEQQAVQAHKAALEPQVPQA